MGQPVAGHQGLTLARSPGGRGSISAFFAPRRRTRLALLLTPPMLWLVVAYLGAIAAMLLTALWTTNSFTGKVERILSGANLHALVTDPLYRTVTLRTV